MAQKSKQKSFKAEVHYCADDKTACDGGTLGHPRVYLQMNDAGQAICPYCDRQYIQTGGVGDKR